MMKYETPKFLGLQTDSNLNGEGVLNILSLTKFNMLCYEDSHITHENTRIFALLTSSMPLNFMMTGAQSAAWCI
jgi:hypothetical protein